MKPSLQMRARNVDLADEFVAPDFVDYTNKIEGLEGLKQFGNRFFKGFPDLHWTIEDIVAEEDKVWVRTTVTGTHRGEYLGVPPTGKDITIRCVDVWRIVDGKIVEAWAVDDLLDFYKKLDVRVCMHDYCFPLFWHPLLFIVQQIT